MDMTAGNPWGCIFRFAFPLMLANIFQQIYTFADTAVVGRILGMEALAVLGATEWLTFLMFGAVLGLTTGLGVTVAQAWGARETDRVKQTVFHTFVLSAAAAAILLLLGLVSLNPLIRLMGTPEEIQGAARRYLRVLYGGIPITFAYQSAAAILRAVGDSRTPFAAIAAASILNVLLDVWFVGILGFGIPGAAAATVLAQLFSAVWCLVRLKKIPELCPKGGCRWDGRLALEQLGLGIPIALQNIVTAAGGLVVQSVINGFGVLFVAGFTAANKLYGLLETAASSYGQAMVTYSGQNVGAGQKRRLKAGMGAAACMGCLTAFVMSAVMIVAGKEILQCFLSGENAGRALEIGQEFLNVLAAFFPLLYLLYILRAGVQGLGNGIIPLLSGWIQLIMRVGCACLLPALIGYQGVFWGEVLAWAGADALLAVSWVYLYQKTDNKKERENDGTGKNAGGRVIRLRRQRTAGAVAQGQEADTEL